MSITNGANPGHDPRVTLVTKKYFSMRPKPLERWLWRQGLPQAVERVYWFHWELGAQHQTWCSQVPIKAVARECCVDPSTVTRAYQVLKALKLIRREDPPRDPSDPFRQLVALTEVLVPRELVQDLAREPNRPNRGAQPSRAVEKVSVAAAPAASEPPATTPIRMSRQDSQRIHAKLSVGERARLYQASQRQSAAFEFDADTALKETEKAYVLSTLESTIRATAAAAAAPKTPSTVRSDQREGRAPAKQRLSLLEQVRVRRQLQAAIPPESRSETAIANLTRQILWSVEEGTLARFPPSHAVNIALKKVREGQWQAPFRMPTDWGQQRATPETCMRAGV